MTLDEIRNLPLKERKNIPYEKLVELVKNLDADRVTELSNLIGYPVFCRLCMGELQHKFVLLQDGAAAIIVNNLGQILLQKRADRDKWGLPGGCQELGERFEDTVIREVKEETNLDILEENLELVAIVSGKSRKHAYPNGDTVFDNTALYCIRTFTGDLKWDEESKELRFFDLNDLPSNQHDPDLIEAYKKYLNN